MARAVYPHELQDQDFAWLINRFQEANPHYILVEASSLPMILIRGEAVGASMTLPPAALSGDAEDDPNAYPQESD